MKTQQVVGMLIDIQDKYIVLDCGEVCVPVIECKPHDVHEFTLGDVVKVEFKRTKIVYYKLVHIERATEDEAVDNKLIFSTIRPGKPFWNLNEFMDFIIGLGVDIPVASKKERKETDVNAFLVILPSRLAALTNKNLQVVYEPLSLSDYRRAARFVINTDIVISRIKVATVKLANGDKKWN